MIEPGEKFACLALVGIEFSGPLDRAIELGYGCWALPTLPVPLDGNWTTWIGSVIAEEIRRANLVLVAKAPSAVPNVQDAEFQALLSRVEYLLWGIAVAAGVPVYDRAVRIGDGCPRGTPEVWSVDRPDRLFPTSEMPRVQVDAGDLVRACGVVAQIESVKRAAAVVPGSYERIARGLRAFIDGLRSMANDARLHQFVRATEACLSPEAWREDAFVEAVRMFVGPIPDAAQTIREIYRLRGRAEHMDDFTTALSNTPAVDRDRVAMRRLRQAHELARRLYESVYSPLHEYREIYRSDESIRRFWREPPPSVPGWMRQSLPPKLL